MYSNIQQEQFTCSAALIVAILIQSNGEFAGTFGVSDNTGFALIAVKVDMSNKEHSEPLDAVLIHSSENASDGIKETVEQYRQLLALTSVS